MVLTDALVQHLASDSSVPALAIASVVAAVLGGLGGVLTAQATRTRGATEGFRDLTTDLQEERDLAADGKEKALQEVDRLRALCWENGIDWRPPPVLPPTPGVS